MSTASRKRQLGRPVSIVGAGMSRFGAFADKDSRDLFVEAGHMCAFHTWGGIMESEEWYGLIEPQCATREDWISGIIAVSNAFGWGWFTVTELEPGKRLVLRVDGSYESNGYLGMYGPSSLPRSYLVTGGAGFIGSHVTEALVRAGYDVRAFVLYNSFNSWGWLDHCGADVRGEFEVFAGDVRDPHGVNASMKGCDTVLHLAALIAIPYSYHSPGTYVETNVIGTLNLLYAIGELDRDIHLVKLGTMGEYGTPNVDIEEGWLELEHNGRRDRVLFPKRPGSFYHLSKVHDSHNMEFTCRAWGLRATDLNQGVVYGQTTPQTALDPRLATRFDYDSVFGTVLNRFVIQAVLGEPLTVYGTGNQIRGLIDIRDTVECIRLAVENPAERGEFRVSALGDAIRVNEIGPAELASFDPAGTMFFNVNTPDDYTRASALATRDSFPSGRVS